jgi:hypothetical protein
LTLVFAKAIVLLLIPKSISVVALALWISGFLFLLNALLMVIYRKKQKRELISYAVAGIIELAIFVFVLLFSYGVIQNIPYALPPGLEFNRAEIGAALAIGIGLFPAAYWHSVNLSEVPARIAKDGKAMKERKVGVHVPPGEWMN